MMEEKSPADPDTPASQPLSAEINMENRGESVPIPDQSSNRKAVLAEVHKVGATRLAGFLYWTNIAVIVCLMIGFVAPGWIAFSARHRMYPPENSYRQSESDFKYVRVYQDYALFYMTQCAEHNDYTNDEYYHTCETMSYRTIDHLYRDRRFDYSKIEIEDKEITGDDRCIFRGAGLVMNSSKITRVQALYTAGVLLCIFTLYIWSGYRADVANDNFRSFSRLWWLLMFTVSAIAAIILFVPVIMFTVVRGEVFSDGNGNDLEKSLGSVFGGFGAGFMVLITIIVFMQLICCRTPGTYICSCTDEPGTSVPVKNV